MMLEALKNIGLSPKEAEIYLVLIRYGTRPTSFIAKKANLNRGTAYVVLHTLLEKGLAAKSVKRKIQYFTPLEPDRLVTYLSRKASEIEQQKRSAASLVQQLQSIAVSSGAKPHIEFFEGQEGARAAMEDTLTCREKLLRAFLSLVDIAEYVGPDYFESYTDRRVTAGIPLRALRTLEQDKEAFRQNKFAPRYITNSREQREVRYLSDELAFPMTMYLYDNKILAISSKEENFALIIESRELCEMQKKLFQLLWGLQSSPEASAAKPRPDRSKSRRR